METTYNKLLNKIEKAKKLRGLSLQFERDYRIAGNNEMATVSGNRFVKFKNMVNDLYDQIKPLQQAQRKEYEKTPVHQFLMASKGLNGKQILTHYK